MIAIKGMSIPKYCNYWDTETRRWVECPIYKSCKHHTSGIDVKPADCPLVEIGTCKDCKQLGVMDCGYYCKLNHWGKISKESNYGGMGDFYCKDFEKRGDKNG